MQIGEVVGIIVWLLMGVLVALIVLQLFWALAGM